MSVLTRLFRKSDPNAALIPLYDAIVREGRQPHWYEHGGVADTIDGRFDMIAAILSLVLLRLEDGDAAQQSVWLTELFVSDMDGQLRQIGIGDMVVGKHIGRMMSALGGRLTAYRAALKGDADLGEALLRNLYRGQAPQDAALAHARDGIARYWQALNGLGVEPILRGELPQ